MYPGEVHALMGENGAGKSTLMKILSGAYIPDPGAEILIDGKPVHIDGPLAAKAHGIAIIYQELALAPNLTVAENIYLGREAHRGPAIDRAAMFRAAATILRSLGADIRTPHLVGDLSIAEQQMVEVARAIHAHSRILVMDEPTTALSSRETHRLFEVILRAEGRRPRHHLHLAIAWRRCTSWPTASRCCATAAMSARWAATRSSPRASCA